MAWVLKRLLGAAVLVWIVTTLVFLGLRLIPGDPAAALLGGATGSADPVAVASLRAELGLDRPLLAQYRDSMIGILQGDLGTSLQDRSPIAAQVALRLPRSLELILAAVLISFVIAVPLGLVAARYRDGLADRVMSGLFGLSLGVPVFLTGSLLVYFIGQKLRWVRVGGYVPFADDPVEHLKILLLPAIAISFGLAPILFRMTRASVIEVMRRDYVRTAHAKGAGAIRIARSHVLPNAMIPIVTILGLEMGALLGGTVLVEVVFNWPGLSRMLIDAVYARDYPVVSATVLVVSVSFVLINLAVDMLYTWLDPRIGRS